MRWQFVLICSFFFGLSLSAGLLTDRKDGIARQEKEGFLYVVTDKSVYLLGETLWFASYLSDPQRADDDSLAVDLLSLSLVCRKDSTVMLRREYLVKDGLCPGSLSLPDTLSPGDYLLLFSGNVVDTLSGVSRHVFGKRVELRDPEYGAAKPPSDTDSVGEDFTLQVKALEVGFYPQGGDLVSGIRSSVGWETLLEGFPLAVEAVLLEDGHPIDSISTDESGLGSFLLDPLPGSRYSVVPLAGSYGIAATEYTLPDALDRGAVLDMASAVVEDTLFVTLRTAEYRRLRLVIGDLVSGDTGSLGDYEVDGERYLRVSLGEAARGLHTLTLLDEAGRPLCEAVFFSHYGDREVVRLSTDSVLYRPGDSIRVRLDTDGLVERGLMTVWCAHVGRDDSLYSNDIASYHALSPLLGTGMAGGTQRYRERDRLELELLVRGWRRHLWQGLVDGVREEGDFVKLRLGGQVLRRDGRKLREPVQVVIRRDSVDWQVLDTDADGWFFPLMHDLTVEEGKYLEGKILQNGDPNAQFVLRAEDPLHAQMHRLAKELPNSFPSIPKEKSAHAHIQEIGHSLQTQIEKVTVSARQARRNHMYTRHQNECGDYVCMSNVLNCENHDEFDARNKPPPVEGGRYIKIVNNELIPIIYRGCKLDSYDLQVPDALTVYTARAFYGGSEGYGGSGTYGTTLHWEPYRLLDKSGSDVVFPAGMIPGIYRIRAEGISSSGQFVSAETMVMIKGE